MPEIKLHRQAATALMRRARGWEFDSAARELVGGDEGQRAEIEACIEIIGRLSWDIERWPQEEYYGTKVDQQFVEVELSSTTLDWIERERGLVAAFIGDLDGTEASSTDPGYVAEHVYLRHVLDGILGQREAVAA